MTNEQNFKVGDKVRTKRSHTIILCGYEGIIAIGDEGIVRDMAEDTLDVYFPEHGVILTSKFSDVELVTPLDRRTAFLRELQALLRKYDAEISYDTQCEKFEIYFCDGFKIVDNIFYPLQYPEFVDYEDDYIGYLNLDADNIMDFVKE